MRVPTSLVDSKILVLVIPLVVLFALHCGSGGGQDGSGAPTSDAGDDGASTTPVGDGGLEDFTLGGTIRGLQGTGLVLQNNAGDDLIVPASASAFTFASRVAAGGSYAVTVKTQPSSPMQECTVTNGTGTAAADVTNVSITCVAKSFEVCPTVTGLASSTGDAGLDEAGAGALVLENGGGDGGASDVITVSHDGVVCFGNKIESGAPYHVTAVDPTNPAQTCVVSGGSGTVTSGDVTSIAVNCAIDTYTLGGSITGLAGSVVLAVSDASASPSPADAGADAGAGALQEVTVAANGTYAFPSPLPSGLNYTVGVKQQPDVPIAQVCTVTNATGEIGRANVTNVNVACTTVDFKVTGTISGLYGSGLVLQNNGANNQTVPAGATSFAYTVPSGQPYAITILTQPTGQVCVVGNGSGTVGNADVTGITVACSSVGQQAFTTPGDYTLTVPPGVTSVSVVVVGGGGAGSWGGGRGGGGGALCYANNVAVSPGAMLPVHVGAAGLANASGIGGASTFGPLTANGGGTGAVWPSGSGGTGTGGTCFAGGNGGTIVGGGGAGGGGAAGYAGNGGNGDNSSDSACSTPAATAGAGGGGGGGGARSFPSYSCSTLAGGGGGGGVGILGQGASGTAGASTCACTGSFGAGGGGGSNGTAGAPSNLGDGGAGGAYGGGGGGTWGGTATAGDGSGGAVRIIWGPNRAFPSTNTGDM